MAGIRGRSAHQETRTLWDWLESLGCSVSHCQSQIVAKVETLHEIIAEMSETGDNFATPREE
jgi:hypothetical protein